MSTTERKQQQCLEVSLQENGHLIRKGNACKNINCTRCKQGRHTLLINKYLAPLNTFLQNGKLYFLTITPPTSSFIPYSTQLDKMYQTWKQVAHQIKRKGIKLCGIRKIESIQADKTIKPSYQMVIAEKEVAELFKQTWIQQWNKQYPKETITSSNIQSAWIQPHGKKITNTSGQISFNHFFQEFAKNSNLTKDQTSSSNDASIPNGHNYKPIQTFGKLKGWTTLIQAGITDRGTSSPMIKKSFVQAITLLFFTGLTVFGFFYGKKIYNSLIYPTSQTLLYKKTILPQKRVPSKTTSTAPITLPSPPLTSKTSSVNSKPGTPHHKKIAQRRTKPLLLFSTLLLCTIALALTWSWGDKQNEQDPASPEEEIKNIPSLPPSPKQETEDHDKNDINSTGRHGVRFGKMDHFIIKTPSNSNVQSNLKKTNLRKSNQA